MRRMLGLILMVLLMIATGGCVPETADSIAAQTSSVPTETPTPTPEPTPEPTPTPIMTPIKTTEPDPLPTPRPTPEPTPSLPEGSVVVAEGFYYHPLTSKIKSRINGISYPEDDDDIQISYDDLVYVNLKHYNFDGEVLHGELIVNKQLGREVAEIFYELYKAEYPLASVKLVSDYGQPGNDTASMTANNTSSFCYRRVTGSRNLSRHSYGAAIDINPMMNPYINGDRFSPKNGEPYLDRDSGLAGMIDHDDFCYRTFKDYGWSWGGDWNGDKDWQHFSKDIGF